MTRDLQVVNKIAIIVEDPDTTPMSVRLPTKEEKIHLKGEVEEKNPHQGRGVEMIVMNEDPHGEAKIQKGRTSHQRATQNEDIKLMLVNGYPAPTMTPREACWKYALEAIIKVLLLYFLVHDNCLLFML